MERFYSVGNLPKNIFRFDHKEDMVYSLSGHRNPGLFEQIFERLFSHNIKMHVPEVLKNRLLSMF